MNRFVMIVVVSLVCFGLFLGQTTACETCFGYLKSVDTNKATHYQKVSAVINCGTAVISITNFDFDADVENSAKKDGTTTWYGYLKRCDTKGRKSLLDKVSITIDHKTLVMEIKPLPKDFKIKLLLDDAKIEAPPPAPDPTPKVQ